METATTPPCSYLHQLTSEMSSEHLQVDLPPWAEPYMPSHRRAANATAAAAAAAAAAAVHLCTCMLNRCR